jgi:hypothetical protein
MSLDELKDKLRVDTREVFVWRSGFEDWKPVADVAELTPEQPTFVFTDTDAGRKSFFNLQCKYGDVQWMEVGTTGQLQLICRYD